MSSIAILEEFGRHKGKIAWNVKVFYVERNHYSYRIHLGGRPVNASREHPEGALMGKYEKPTDALTAGRMEALKLAERMMERKV